MLSLAAIQVIVPALDEEATIGGVVESLRARGLERIRVVDNGSRDETAARARAAGAEVITEARRGYGQACWTGAQHLPPEVEWILFADADGSDDPDDVARLVEEAGRGADLVLGDRRARSEARAVMTPVQNFGNALATTLIRLGWGQVYHDLGPLRLVRRRLFEEVGMEDRGFGWTIELQVRASELGARIVELPVAYGPRRGGKSKISGTIKGSVQAGTIILATLGRLWARRCLRQQTLWGGLAGGLLLLGAVLMAPYGEFARPNVVRPFLAAAGVMGAGFALSWLWRGGVGWRGALWFWTVAAGARLLLLPMEPGDDVWRYLWEGRAQVAGYSPYHYAPGTPGLVIEGGGVWQEKINHPQATAIYPPLAQLFLRAVAAVGGGVLTLKLVFIAAELLTAALLVRRFGRGAATLYAWNPLVIYCGAGGAHYDSLFVLGLTLAWLAWDDARPRLAAWMAGVSVGLKWISAPLVAWFVWRAVAARTPGRGLLVGFLGVAPVAAGLGWFVWRYGAGAAWWPGEFVAKARGMDLVPWLVGLRWPASLESNGWIPFALAPAAAWVFFRARSAAGFAEGWLALLLIFSPSNHAWYFTWLAPLAAATGNLGTRLISLSAFVYFQVWQTLAETGRWEQSPVERLVLWAPFLIGLVWSLARPRGAGTENFPGR